MPRIHQGTIRPALERLKEQYRIKAVELSHDLQSLEEQVVGGEEVLTERLEEKAELEKQASSARMPEIGGRSSTLVKCFGDWSQQHIGQMFQ